MDAEYESSLLRLIDEFLRADHSAEAFQKFRPSFSTFYYAGRKRATWFFTSSFPPELDGKQLPDELEDELDRLMDELLPHARFSYFDQIRDRLYMTIPVEPSAAERTDGYRSINELVGFLKQGRKQYRDAFGV